MSSDNVQKIVQLLADDNKVREAFLDNPEKCLADLNLSMLKEQVEAVLESPDLDTVALKKKLDELPVMKSRVDDVEVICACGHGYFYQ